MNSCMNPAAKSCNCPSCDEEKQSISRLRNQVIYSGIPGPIVEWTLSDWWRNAPQASGDSLPALLGEIQNAK